MQTGPLPAYARVPVGLFGAVLGLGGLALVWRSQGRDAALSAIAPAAAWISEGAAVAAFAVFAVIAVAYGAKAIRYWPRVTAEFCNPVVQGFFAAIGMSLLVLALCVLPHNIPLARALWTVGAATQLGLALAIGAYWWRERPPRAALAPSLFLPAVGGMLATLGGVPLGETFAAWFFFVLGCVLGVPLAALIIDRLIRFDPLPPPLRPTLVIFVAPPALAYLAWLQLRSGSHDALGYALFVVLMVALAYVAALAPGLARLAFGAGWWAYTFPLALASSAALGFAEADGGILWRVFALTLAAMTTVVILMVLIRSLIALKRGRLLPPG